MSQVIKVVKHDDSTPTMHGDGTWNSVWRRANFKSQMVMLRCHVDSAVTESDRDNAEFIYSQLMEQCKKLSRKFGFSVIP